jgi:REP element-mobilizing transposase RayT
MDGFQFFDPKQDFTVAWKTLPHWAQAGTLCFITWRTRDSLPAAAESRITRERSKLVDHPGAKWSVFEILDGELDHNFGQYLLARPECSEIVANSLLHFDNERYLLTDFVVMPNHVHVLVAFHDIDSIITQCENWKRFSARRINQLLGYRGEFWQVEQFDHLVRGPEYFQHFRQYIAENPSKARLATGSYRHYSKTLVST